MQLEVGPETPRPTQSAVIVAVPEAESVVGAYRRRFDAAAAWGVPAHVTVLYPFLEPQALTPETVERLRDVIRHIEQFTCDFRRTCWFGQEVLWLAPEPDAPFRVLTDKVVAAFPANLPYGGSFGQDVVPHLTVAEARLATRVDDLLAAEQDLAARLPLTTTVNQALLIAGSEAPNSWRLVARLPLGVA